MLYETDDWKMDPYHMELNLFTDTILQVLFRHGRGRHIFLSSFSPELCIMLAVKQKTYPVLFLNDSNLAPTGDPRALSLQSAIHFARRWKLQGVVMASEPFVSSPKLVKFVQKQKLFCASYGNLNDDPECAKVRDYIFLNVGVAFTK
jgi:glycerophosphodiester phosphodiesterase